MSLRLVGSFVAASIALAGCALHQESADRMTRLRPEVVQRVVADAAAQVKRCYRAPRVLGEGRRISTRLHVRYGPDGNLLGLPVVVSQSGITPSNHMFADEMAQAAIASVMRCSPLKLPPELYAFVWNDFELTFSPALRG